MPERLAAQLAEINERGTSERANAEQFMTTLRSHLEDNPEYGNNEAVRTQIEIFERNLQAIDAEWARAQLDVLASTRSEIDALRPVEVREFSDPEIRDAAEYTLERADRLEIRGDREVYLFQYFFNQTDISADILVDGVAGDQTKGTIQNNIRATQIFLRELGVSSVRINGELDENTVNAIQEQFGVTLAVVTPSVAERERAEVADSEIRRLAIEVIGEPLNEERIESYQRNHNIEVNGELGGELYFEMLAGEMKNTLIETDITENGINEEQQNRIIHILENVTLTGTDAAALLILLEGFRSSEASNPNFEAQYGSFYRNIERIRREFSESPEGEARVREAEGAVGRNGRSLYSIMTDDSIPLSERIQEVATDPLLLTAGAILFLFGVFGSNSRFTDSFWKRLGIVLGGAIFGPAVWNRLGVGEALGDLDETLGVTQGLDNLFNGTSGNARDRIIEVRNTPGNELNRLFPEEGLLTRTLSHFETIEELRTISLDDLQGYVTALRNGETDDLPSFLTEITIDGTRLTNEQIAIVLESMVATRGEGDSTILDLFEGLTVTETIGGALFGGGLVLGLVRSFPPIATWSIIVGGATLAWDNRDGIIEYMQGFSFFNGLEARVDNLLAEIIDESLRENVETLLQNSDTALETKISALQEIARANPAIESQIASLVDILVGVYVESLNEISRSVERIADLDSAVTILGSTIPLIEANVTNEEEKNRLLTLIRDRITEIESETEVRRITEARERVTSLGDEIRGLEEDIERLNREREDLILERPSADARRLAEIDARIAAIPGEIAGIEAQIAEKRINLETARIGLADIEVETSTPVVASHISFLENEIANAISAQGIIAAVNNNGEIIMSIAIQIEQINETITLAADSPEKAALTASIEQARGIVEGIKSSYRDEFGSEVITSEALEAEGFDLGVEASFTAFGERMNQLTGATINPELATFIGVELQDPEEVKEVFKQEFERQIQAIEAGFDGAPVNNVQTLRQMLLRREEMIGRYSNLFELEYENTEFQDIVSRKQAEIEDLNVSNIEGFEDLYRGLVDGLEANDAEKGFLIQVFEQDVIFSGLRTFFTETIVTGDIDTLSDSLEQHLATEFFAELEAHISIGEG